MHSCRMRIASQLTVCGKGVSATYGPIYGGRGVHA